MKYISLDLETTSLVPSAENILMISMIVEDTNNPLPLEDLPHFTCFVKQKEPIQGQLYALAMNGWILDIISGRAKDAKYPIYTAYPAEREVETEMDCWDEAKQQIVNVKAKIPKNIYWIENAIRFVNSHFPNTKRVTVAGKNVAGFDMQFLPKELKGLFKHKTLDPATLYVDWNKDEELPGLEECKKRAGIHTPVAHDAYEDALDVIRLFRNYLSVGDL